MAQQEHAGLIDQIRVGAEVEIEIRPHAAAGINADGAFESLGRVAGVFQGLPRHFHEMTVLRIKDRGLFRGKPEKVGVEIGDTVEGSGRGHIVRAAQAGGAFARGQQFSLGQHADRFHTVDQIGPIGGNIGCARQMRRHADNSDIGLGHAGEILGHHACTTPCSRRQTSSRHVDFTLNPAQAIPLHPSQSDHVAQRDNATLMPQSCPSWPGIKADHPTSGPRLCPGAWRFVRVGKQWRQSQSQGLQPEGAAGAPEPSV